MNRRNGPTVTTLAVLTSAALLIPAERAAADEEWRRASTAVRDALAAGDFADARRRLDAATKRAETFAQNDWRRADTRYIAGRVHLAAGDYQAALDAFRAARDGYESLFGAKDATVVRTLSGAGRALTGLGQTDAARAEFGAALDAAADTAAGLEASLGLAEIGLSGAASASVGETLASVSGQMADASPALRSWYSELQARWNLRQGKRTDAEAALSAAAERSADRARQRARIDYLRAMLSLEWGEYGAAAAQLGEVIQRLEGTGSREHPDLVRALMARAAAEQQLGRGRDADAALLRAQSIARRVLSAAHPLRAELAAMQARSPVVQGNLKSAVAGLARLLKSARQPNAATLQAELAEAQVRLGNAGAAAQSIRAGAGLAANTADPVTRARQRLSLAISAGTVGDEQRASSLLQAAREDLTAADPNHPLQLRLAAGAVAVSLGRGDLAGADEQSADLLDRANASLQPGSLTLADIQAQRIHVMRLTGALSDAVTLAEASHNALASAVPGTTRAAESERLLAETLFAAGRLKDAVTAAAQALDTARKAFPNRHPALARFQLPVARSQLLAGRVREAASATSAAISVVRSAGQSGPEVAAVYLAAADVELARGRVKAAVTHHEKAASALTDWPPAAIAETLLNDLAASQSRGAIMAGDTARALDVLQTPPPAQAASIHTRALALASAQSAVGQLDQASAALDAGSAALDVAPGGAQYKPSLQQALALLQARMGRVADAATTQRLATEASTQTAGALHPQTVAARRDLAALLRQGADAAGAADALNSARNDAASLYADDDPGAVAIQVEAALQLEAEGKLAEASRLLTEAQQTLEKTLRAEHPDVASVASIRARMLTEAGSFGEADNLLKRVATNLKRTFGSTHLRVATNALAQARLTLARGQPADTEKRIAALRKTFAPALNSNPEFGAAVTLVEAEAASQLERWRSVLALTERAPSDALLRDRALLIGLRAQALAQTGQIDAAIDASQAALTQGDAAFGLGHPGLAPLYATRARIVQAAGRGADAVSDLQGALDAMRARVENHPAIAAMEAELATQYAYLGRFTEAVETAQQAVQTAAALLGEEHPRTAAYGLVHASALAASGNYAEAEDVFKRTRTLQQRVLGYQNPALGGSAIALADLYVGNGNTAAAQPLLQRAKVLAGNRPSPAGVRVALAQANLLIATGALDGAERALSQAVKAATEVWGADSPELLEPLLGRAEVALARRNQSDVTEALDRAGRLADRSPNSLDGARIDLVRARLALQTGDLDTANNLQQSAVAALEARFGPDHPRLADAIGDFARQLLGLGRTDPGLAELERALGLLSSSLDAAHPRIVALQIVQAAALLDAGRVDDANSVLANLPAVDDSTPAARAASLRYVRGLQAQRAGDLATAETLLAQAVADSERLLGTKHPVYAERVVGWSAALIAADKASDAGPRLNRALSVLENAYGKESPNIAAALGLLSAVALDAGQDRRALQLLQRQLTIIENSFGSESSRLAPVLANLGQLRERTGDLEQASGLLQRAVDLSERHHGPDHIDTATDKSRLAAVMTKLRKTKEAESLYTNALQVFEATLEPGDPVLLGSLRALAALKLAHGESEAAADLAARATRQ